VVRPDSASCDELLGLCEPERDPRKLHKVRFAHPEAKSHADEVLGYASGATGF
jgi:hypothetical protein